MPRTRPNLIITGTPGVGKSSHCELLAQITELGLKHLSINRIVKERNCNDGYDDELKSHIVDEDKLLDEIEDEVKEGGCIIDWHILLLYCVRTRPFCMTGWRNGRHKKLQENLDAEIMQVILEEAREAYDEEAIIELRSNTIEEIDSNVDRISAWAKHWIQNNPEGV
ncbi:P-loop containing nucleoside triphosphate hydrolase protein [Choiromyces venosus 120613-1]|uniref:Adenylate kinase isoenzyme 6 homolog n=1 Tax=Choiromyces venosus 120613-1 TaxID=1336337 RepID=A0A3N4JCH2_9PEZI|nr:P-loop containing nucleoside triphosphate hydrolase protein [Choiromyces venosus 120613-1]